MARLARHRALDSERAGECRASESAEEREAHLARCRLMDKDRARECRTSESAEERQV